MILVARAVNDGGVLLVHLHLTRMTEHIQRRFLQLHAGFGGDDGAAGQDGNILQHFLAAVAEARRLDRNAGERAAQLVDNQRGQRLALDVLGDDEQLLAHLHHLLQQGQDFLNDGNLLVGDKDQRIIQHRFHLFGVGHHVGGRIAAVELHPFDDGHARGHGLAFFHGDNAIRADSFHCVGNQLADGFIRSGVRGDVGNRLLAVDGLGQLLQAFHGGIRRGGNALLQHHGVCAGGEVAQAFADNRLREQGGGGRAVASDVVGLGGDFLHQLRAHVFKGVFQLNFLGDGHTVVGNERRAVLLVQHHVATLRAESDFDGIRQRVHALFKAPASLFAILNLLSHKTYFLSINCGVSLLLHHSQNVALAHNNQLFAVDFDFRAGVLAVNNLLTFRHLHLDFLAIHIAAGADSENNRHLRLLLRGAGQNQTRLGGFLGFNILDDNAVTQRLHGHSVISSLLLFRLLALTLHEC